MKNISYEDLNHMVFEIKNLGCITLEIYICYAMVWSGRYVLEKNLL